MLRVKEEVERKYGRLNIVINAAGGNVRSATVPQEQMADGGDATFFDVATENIQTELDLNLRGTWMPSKILTPLMLGQEGACVINISSMSAFGPLTKIPGYSAAKAGVSNYTQWLATYLARSGVRVNAIAPGFFRTEQNRALQFNPDGTPIPPYHAGFPALATIPRHGRIGLQGIHNTEATVRFKYLRVKEIK